MTAATLYAPGALNGRLNRSLNGPVNGPVNGSLNGPLPRLRLTRRGRAVVTVLVTALIIGLALMLSLVGGMATANTEPGTGAFEYVTVEAGQSLWQVAESVAPGADPRDVISDIVRLNQLQSSVVRPGDRLAIPAAYAR
ncbi:MAG: LysM peptidoglycan-binding domain-containing protein [Cryobacterium sp.]|nr:LysM peptidoglycan-binding domain-containing protein [Micrococcales bacterium]MBX3079296.1 LysM peptidoglycan-binding domain-containing protein [Cryobacterium sp.]MBX3310100.1 LysM peptidoglycan-binding domain-containing protein [Cryobacterium sp.]